jgi:hypothetical protein
MNNENSCIKLRYKVIVTNMLAQNLAFKTSDSGVLKF